MAVIRLATVDDRKGIDKINQEFGDHEYSHGPQFFADAMATQNIFVATEDNQIVGYVIYHILWGNTPLMELLQVTTAYQRKGVGSQLVKAVENKLKSEGYNELLSSTEKINDLSIAFHTKQGFQSIGELDMIYGKEIFYLKKLT